MRVLAVAFVIAFVAAASALRDEEAIHSEKRIEAINRIGTTWTAGVNEMFVDKSVGEVRALLGVPYQAIRNTGLNNVAIFGEEDVKDVPTEFDSRKQWPDCIGAVRDQGQCGSCWAFGAVEALSDRLCIQSQGQVKVNLAAVDLTACDNSDDGCNGGWPSNAWSYMEENGCVTDDCAPYPFPQCHHPCGTPLPTPSCNTTCVDGRSWQGDKHYAKNVYEVRGSDMQKEIMTNGPIEGAFEVYEDFVNYKSGVYKHTSGGFLGGHAIKIIGWGVDNGTPFWTVQNSWNTGWGDGGYFKILRGTDECGIESGSVAGMAKV